RGATISDELAIGFEASAEGAAQTLLVSPALVGRNGIAIGMAEAVFLRAPVDRPLDPAIAAKLRLAEERLRRDGCAPVDGRRQEIAEAAREVQLLLLRDIGGARYRLVADPADLDAAKEVGLGAGEAIDLRRLEARAVAEDLRVRMKADRGA